MFNFDKQKFNFNSVQESSFSNAVPLSLDDDDDIVNDITNNSPISNRPTIKRNIIQNKTNFYTFLLGKVFNPIGVSFDNPNSDDRNASQAYAWKEIIYDGARHFIAFITIKGQNQTPGYDLYIDLNDDTKELNIGNCTPFKKPYYFNISYPLIKICENYTDGPVYINDIYVDVAYSYRETANEILNKIEYPLIFPSVKQEISIFRCIWNNKKYYYPPHVRSSNEFIEIDKNLMLSSDFINHLAGFKNNFNEAKVSLFYKAFNSFEDFAKLTDLFCNQNAKVFTEFDTVFSKYDYEEVLAQFRKKVDMIFYNDQKIKQENEEKENKAKMALKEMLDEKIFEHFDSINEKAPNLLTVKTMFKERKSNNPYRKFDLPVIKLILKDNGIDVDKIVEKYEKEWEDAFYKFINILNSHFDRIKCQPSYKSILVCNMLQYGAQSPIYNKIVDGPTTEPAYFDGYTQEELELLKVLECKLHVYNRANGQYYAEVNKSRLDDTSENTIKMANDALYILGTYPNKNICEIDNIHTYNEIMILQRFVYMLGKLCAEDYNKEHEDKPIHLPRTDALYDMGYNRISFKYGEQLLPYNCSDINMKINSYDKLYKFIEYIAYIIENGYNITVPNLSINYKDGIYKLLNAKHMIDEPDNIIKNEFNYANKPNVNALDMTSINRCLLTIFTNIDKKI